MFTDVFMDILRRVHISRAALDHLHGEYVVEMNSAAKELRDKGVETYTIVSAHPRRVIKCLWICSLR